MKTILIPTNFTDVSRHATDYAIKLYRNEELKIILLNAYDQPKTGRSVHVSLADILKKNAIKGLEEDKARIEEMYEDLNCKIILHPSYGDLSDSIKSVLDKNEVDIIVMGSNGNLDFIDMFVESITARIIKNIDHPMLIVPPIAKLQKLEDIILTTDLLEISSPDVIKQMTDLCLKNKAKVHVLNISKTGIEKSTEMEKHLSKHLENIEHDFNYRISNDIPKGIYRYIYETNSDIVTIIKRKGHGSLVDRLFQQSVSRKIIKHIRQTLLLFTD